MAKLIEKLHVNMGHLSRDRMVVMLRAAGAREDVLEFMRKRFGCELCDRRQREVRRRVAAFPRTFTFNRIVAVDTFYLPWRGRSLPVLNVVDHGSHYQVTTLIKTIEGKEHPGGTPSSEEAWRIFNECWIRPFGAPEVVLSDGGAEFAKDFVTGLELHSVFHHVVDADSPWQNGVAERHGGEIKRRVLRELAEGNTVLTSTEGIDLMLCHLNACKNQFYSRAGYSPAQLVFGRNPRVPEELLSDLVASAPGRQAMASDPTNLEGSETELHHPPEGQRTDVRERISGTAATCGQSSETQLSAVCSRPMGLRLSALAPESALVRAGSGAAPPGDHHLDCDARPVVEM